jgi:hypothetical protein
MDHPYLLPQDCRPMHQVIAGALVEREEEP